MTKVLDRLALIDEMYATGGPALPKGSFPNEGQRNMHASRARRRLASWGRRAGKTFSGATDRMPTMFGDWEDGFPHIGWIVCPNYELGEREYRVLWHHLVVKLKVPMDFAYYTKGSGAQMGFRTKWGAEVWVRSAEKPDKSLLGEGLSWVIMAEAARMERSIWDQYIEPALADRQGEAIFNSTPQGMNWYHDFYQRGQNPDMPDWESWQFPSWVNKYRFKGGLRFLLDGTEIPWERVAADPTLPVRPHPESNINLVRSWQQLSRHYFWQEYGAQFRTQAGRIYPEFDRGYHVGKYPFRRGLRNFRTIDYGTTNPFVCLDIQVDAQDNVYVWREHRRVGHSTQDNVRWCGIPQDLGYEIEAVVGDPYEPDGRITTENEWAIPCQFVTLGVKNGIELVQRWLKLQPNDDDVIRPKLFFDESCVGAVAEMGAYRWKNTLDEENSSDEAFQLQDDGKDGPREVPLKQNDHAPDALRNWFAWMWGSTMVMHGDQHEAFNEPLGQGPGPSMREQWWSNK